MSLVNKGSDVGHVLFVLLLSMQSVLAASALITDLAVTLAYVS